MEYIYFIHRLIRVCPHTGHPQCVSKQRAKAAERPPGRSTLVSCTLQLRRSLRPAQDIVGVVLSVCWLDLFTNIFTAVSTRQSLGSLVAVVTRSTRTSLYSRPVRTCLMRCSLGREWAEGPKPVPRLVERPQAHAFSCLRLSYVYCVHVCTSTIQGRMWKSH